MRRRDPSVPGDRPARARAVVVAAITRARTHHPLRSPALGRGRLGDTLKLHASDEVDRAAIEVIKSHLDAHAQCNAGAGETPLPTLRVR